MKENLISWIFPRVHLKSLVQLLIILVKFLQNFTVVDSFCTSKVVYWQKDMFKNLEWCVCEAIMPQSQEQGGILQGRDVGEMLNFPTTGHSVETRRRHGQRKGKIHRNSSNGIHELRYNSNTTVKVPIGNFRSWCDVMPYAIITYLHLFAPPSKVPNRNFWG